MHIRTQGVYLPPSLEIDTFVNSAAGLIVQLDIGIEFLGALKVSITHFDQHGASVLRLRDVRILKATPGKFQKVPCLKDTADPAGPIVHRSRHTPSRERSSIESHSRRVGRGSGGESGPPDCIGSRAALSHDYGGAIGRELPSI